MLERFECGPRETRSLDTSGLRETFMIPEVIQTGKILLTYSHYDRMVIGGAAPANGSLELTSSVQLKSDYFLERREIGIINVGGNGSVKADGTNYELGKLDCLYLGKGVKDVQFTGNGAKFFLLSAPAHHQHPSQLMKKDAATPAEMGASTTANERIIYKYIHPDGVKSCQLVMGLTILKPGSIWNTMPAHTHNRRMEAYFYFDLPEDHRVFHLMGQPQETRHIVVKNEQAVISPPWSIHSGCGTSSYSFIWGMAGENQSFADMDFIELKDLL